MTRTCKYEPCSKEFEPTHSRHEFCEPTCRANQHYLEHPEKGRSLQGGALRSVATHPLDEARAAQALKKEKRMWRLVIEVQIGRTLLETGYFHADDLDALGVPREHGQLKGTRTAAVSDERLMVKTGAERARSNPASNGRKASIYQITAKGREVFASWIDTRQKELVGLGTEGEGLLASSGPLSVEPDEKAASVEHGCAKASASGADTLQVSGASSEALTLLPEPPAMFDPDQRAA